jgi:hypothetical protein
MRTGSGGVSIRAMMPRKVAEVKREFAEAAHGQQAIIDLFSMTGCVTGAESRTGVKQIVSCAQLIIQKISQGFDSGNALESGVAQYPQSQSHAAAHGSDHP